MGPRTFPHRWVGILAAVLWVLGPDSLFSGLAGSTTAAAQDDMGIDLSGSKKKKEGKKPEAKPGKKPDKQPQTKPSKKPGGKAGGSGDTGLGFDALDVSVKSLEKEQMEKALDLMKDEDYASAAVQLWDLYNNPKAKQFFQATEYQIAKALYRMGLYHSALVNFGKILEKGLDHKYFKTSLEWLFFISHKITDQKEVLQYIARYSDIEFPKKYKDEFLFLLAKYFYYRALDIEKAGQQAVGAPPGTPEEKGTGAGAAGDEFGFDLTGGSEGESKAKPGKGKGKGKAGEESDGFGLDLEVEKKAGATALPTDAVGFLSKSRALILQVSDKGRFYPKVKYLEGIIAFKEENFQAAAEAFKETVRILNPRKGKYRDDTLREMAFFQLARVHYGHKQFRNSLFYYDRIHRDSINWLESLFESSWAWFRLGGYPKALGNLITLDSPFFREEYFPEGLVLRAVTYFENCRYPESNQIVEEFKTRYEPLFKELDNLLKKVQSPESYYKQLLAIQQNPEEGGAGRLLQRILKLALADKDLQVLNQSVLEIEREMGRIGRQKDSFARSKFSERLASSLRQRKDDLMKEAGLLTKRRLEQERDFLAGLLNQAMRITLENEEALLRVLEGARRGETTMGPTLLSYDWSAATDDEKVYWPYQGEYWRDELGTYEYILTWGCRKDKK